MERIENTVELDVPVEEVFAYYANPVNVSRMTPPELNLRLLRAVTPLRQGSNVVFSLRPRMMPFEFRWSLTIKDFVLNESFSEVLVKGPFSQWRHEHRFAAENAHKTRVTDTIIYGQPTGFAGKLVGPSFVREMLIKTFSHREGILRRDLERAWIEQRQ